MGSRRFLSRGLLGTCALAACIGAACAKGTDPPNLDDTAADSGSAVLDGAGTDSSIPFPDSGPQPDGASKDSGVDAPGGCTKKVVINEIMPEGASNAEFIELYNPNSCAVSLSGWKLLYRSSGNGLGPPLYTFVTADSIGPHAFVVLATSNFAGVKDFTTLAGLGNSGGQVGLVDQNDTVIDGVGYDTGTAGTFTEKTPAALPGLGKSIARKSDGVDTDNNASDFAVANTPTPRAAN